MVLAPRGARSAAACGDASTGVRAFLPSAPPSRAGLTAGKTIDDVTRAVTIAPPSTDSGTTRTDAAWMTPGTRAIDTAADGLISEAAAFWAQGAATATSAPVV